MQWTKDGPEDEGQREVRTLRDLSAGFYMPATGESHCRAVFKSMPVNGPGERTIGGRLTMFCCSFSDAAEQDVCSFLSHHS